MRNHPRPRELTSTVIISDIAKTESKNCCIMHYFDLVLGNHALDQPVQDSRSVQMSKNSGRAVQWRVREKWREERRG